METIKTPIGSYAPDFEIPGVDGGVHHLFRYSGAVPTRLV